MISTLIVVGVLLLWLPLFLFSGRK